jgi:hypothetical protein
VRIGMTARLPDGRRATFCPKHNRVKTTILGYMEEARLGYNFIVSDLSEIFDCK